MIVEDLLTFAFDKIRAVFEWLNSFYILEDVFGQRNISLLGVIIFFSISGMIVNVFVGRGSES